MKFPARDAVTSTGPLMGRFTAISSLAFLVLGATLLIPTSARAGETTCTSEQARTRFEDGLRLLEAGNWQDACLAFDASLACRARASTQTNVAACRERENKLNEALLGYERALQLEKNPSTAQALEGKIRSHIQRLGGLIPRLVFSFAAPVESLTVIVDDRQLSVPELQAPVLVDPGKHHIVVHAAGYRDEHIDVALDAGATQKVEPKLIPVGNRNADEVDAPAPPKERPLAPIATTPAALPRQPAKDAPLAVDGDQAVPPENQGMRTLGIIMGGAGVMTLGFAAGFAFHTRSLVDDAERYCDGLGTCEQRGLDILEQARAAQTRGLVTGGIGLLALGAGIGLVIAHPAPSKSATVSQSPPASPLFSRILLGPAPSGIVASGAF